MAVYEQKKTLHAIHSIKPYLITLVKNKVFNYYRHEIVKEKYLKYLSDTAHTFEGDDINSILESKELHHLLLQNIEQLPLKCKEVFKLSRDQHYTYKEIADKLDISENTVDQHIRKALKLLRESLDRYKNIAVAIAALISAAFTGY